MDNLFKNEWVSFRDNIDKDPYLFCKVEKFSKGNNVYGLCVSYNEAYNYEYDERFIKFDKSRIYKLDNHDYITKLEKYEVKQVFNDVDMLGEEDWDNG
jgi:hypothetical protein